MIYFKEFRAKLRHSHFLRPFFDAMARFGIRITPYYLFSEPVPPENQQPLPDGFEAYEFCFWGPEDMEDIAFIQKRKFTGAILAQRLRKGASALV